MLEVSMRRLPWILVIVALSFGLPAAAEDCDPNPGGQVPPQVDPAQGGNPADPAMGGPVGLGGSPEPVWLEGVLGDPMPPRGADGFGQDLTGWWGDLPGADDVLGEDLPGLPGLGPTGPPEPGTGGGDKLPTPDQEPSPLSNAVSGLPPCDPILVDFTKENKDQDGVRMGTGRKRRIQTLGPDQEFGTYGCEPCIGLEVIFGDGTMCCFHFAKGDTMATMLNDLLKGGADSTGTGSMPSDDAKPPGPPGGGSDGTGGGSGGDTAAGGNPPPGPKGGGSGGTGGGSGGGAGGDPPPGPPSGPAFGVITGGADESAGRIEELVKLLKDMGITDLSYANRVGIWVKRMRDGTVKLVSHYPETHAGQKATPKPGK